MPRCPAVLVVCVTVGLLCSCRRDQASETLVVHKEQPAAGLSSVVQVAEPGATGQLLKGWHPVEQGSWRWTERQFSVALKSPGGSQPATLELKFVLPEALLARLKTVTLSASVNGAPLTPETYGRSGEHFYQRHVPVTALKAEIARVDFKLDRALPPADADRRELGLVVASVRLE